ncbi:uncharacterized protein C8orf34-like isoform X3 [Lethenteron reissneri]|uniref:uncharacterized protein C8orf34-like isoform X3 n=1 Tax=Lethenteron reissneri TaxID=7753 RepID=UPI002AB74AF2|nr:uncharacterized protein C8orf34-like isoform X3 [Lethenteron reissneri]
MSQERLQAYLQRHRIGSLFEDMMTMLITETPDEPIPFLIEHLEGRQHKRTFTEGSPRRDLAGFAALWAESSHLPESSPKGNPFRTYVTLCVDHTKKPRKSKSELAVSCLSPASSEARPMSQSLEPSSRDCSAAKEGDMAFTELQRLLRECQWLDKTLREHTSGIIADDTLGKVSDNGERMTAEQRPRVARARLPHRRGRVQDEVGADLLAAEVLLLPTIKPQRGLGASDAQAANTGQRRANTWAQREQHKLRLAAMLTPPRGHRTRRDGDPHDDDDDEEVEEVTEHLDEAVELLEDEEDLRREGVFAPRRSGFRISRGRMPCSAEPQAKVRLNICSHCARLQGVDDLREDAETSIPGPASFIEKSVSLELVKGTLKDTETRHPTSSTQAKPASSALPEEEEKERGRKSQRESLPGQNPEPQLPRSSSSSCGGGKSQGASRQQAKSTPFPHSPGAPASRAASSRIPVVSQSPRTLPETSSAKSRAKMLTGQQQR